jgi:hypothetical protein
MDSEVRPGIHDLCEVGVRENRGSLTIILASSLDKVGYRDHGTTASCAERPYAGFDSIPTGTRGRVPKPKVTKKRGIVALLTEARRSS